MAIYLIPEPMPQEMGTVEILVEAGLAQTMKSTDDIIAIVENLKRVPNRETQALPTIHNLDRVDAVYDIAQIILDLEKDGADKGPPSRPLYKRLCYIDRSPGAARQL
jgi:hypothetical protein